jgi:hypothetical protein
VRSESVWGIPIINFVNWDSDVSILRHVCWHLPPGNTMGPPHVELTFTDSSIAHTPVQGSPADRLWRCWRESGKRWRTALVTVQPETVISSYERPETTSTSLKDFISDCVFSSGTHDCEWNFGEGQMCLRTQHSSQSCKTTSVNSSVLTVSSPL